ncbi:MAG: hypothetical protein OQK69_01785 [Gammaproteobacteria bacterium]|nr:hypothetical protein [Gammaproteobacteria bacterium]
MQNTTIFALLACTFLTACQQTSNTPKQVAEQYWQALQHGDIAAAKKLVSKNSQASLDNYLALPDEQKILIDKVSLGREQASVTTIINPDAVSGNAPQNQHIEKQMHSLESILILEDGQWKIDASLTQAPVSPLPEASPNLDQLSEALQKNLESMDQAIEQGTGMLNELMKEGSKEMSESLLEGMNKMSEALRQATEKMKQRREQQQTPAPPPADNNGEGLI